MRYRVRPVDPMAAQELGRALGISASVAQVLLHRGLCDAQAAREFLDPQLAGLTVPDAMLDRDRAAERLARAVRARERIAIFGDYDVDGTTSAAILAGILEALGGSVSVRVGDRFDGGYGLSDAALDRVLSDRPSLLVTCDCGSSDHERIERARAAGVDVIVVDHHLVPEAPLPALAFLNPHRPGCGFAYKGLASAGLALSLGAAVRATLGAKLDLRTWLDLVALGTIADVAPLDGDNRRLVRAGLARLSGPELRPAIAVLRELARVRNGAPVSAVDVAFRMTPRLNAAGRMGESALTLSFLRARTLDEARRLGGRIEQRNDERKEVERGVTEAAIAQVIEVYGSAPQSGVVVASDAFHRGVVGISAARLVDRFGVPAIVVGWDGSSGHGSARGPAGSGLYDAIAQGSSCLERFGGHQAAAGVTLRREKLDEFRAAFAAATSRGDHAAPVGAAELLADVELEPGVFDLPKASDLSRLEPLGEANAEPVFALRDAQVVERSVVGGKHIKLLLRVGNESLSAFGYELADRVMAVGERVQAIGALRPDLWVGRERVELRLSHVAPLAGA
jgi:single-stranded-DNA-specific exonuclease